MRAGCAILAVTVALAGCHSSFTPAEPDAGPPIDPLRAFIDARATEECRRGIECEPESSGWWQQLDCHPHYARDEQTLERVRRGALRFDPDTAAECLRMLRAGRGCLSDEERTCFPYVRVLDEGAPCDWPWDDCRDGLYCDHRTCMCERVAPLHGDCSEGTACGEGARCWFRTYTCEPPPALGTPCEADWDCQDDALYCSDGTCAAFPTFAPGDACIGLECGPDLTCQRSTEPEVGLRCEVPRVAGDPCLLLECGRGLACIDGICQPLRTNGEPCEEARDCAPGAAFCVDGRCTANPEGAPCARFAAPPAPASCPAGYRCSVDDLEYSGACVRIVETGGACSVSAQCPMAQRCVGGRCVSVIMPDEPCGPQAVCPRTHVCEGGACAPLPLLGERCDASHPCLDGACMDGRCMHLPGGARCTQVAECEGLCLGGVCTSPVGEGHSCTAAELCGGDLMCTYGGRDPVCVRTCRER